ncbi:bifunctional demethylmenaquinone methyltransferase/2-methoxy-6-polyprenyl-1,4-benzoquinol methylase [Lactobacillus sp. CBA3606]|uniref:demethylmenaquinone methyltransferase n=1 Tax=Lactobacillus sp. CBA3606 TaxID=2099789 RepID=UPI000CFAF52F|nr:demethylmenaquinone methyltransferase [Lactobacillus sp. CBA3606]AVK63978.1 bifunctional demethylmenaquinone methyltransferase/2-methoxy-6-polyprenyl-1,4-benzoquinol methylase [Lactobacillus sp. CBA3606]
MANRYLHNVQGLFDTIAPNYDRMNTIISLGTHRHWRKQTMAQIKLAPSAEVLDLCCGTGDWTIALAQQLAPTGEVIGFDFSAPMLKFAQQKVNQANVANRVWLRRGNAMRLPFKANTFDLVTIGFGLRNLPDKVQALAEIYRVLKPGGQLVCLETSQPDQPLIKPVWQWYFTKIVPTFGRLFAHQYQEYAYLQETTRHFWSYQQLAGHFEQAGFKNVHYQRFNFGAAAAHFGSKPDLAVTHD